MNSIYRRNPSVEASAMKAETLLFDPATNKFCLLNETAAVVWEHLRQSAAEHQLVDAVCETFDGAERSQVARDVQELLRRLDELALITVE
jgi:hypothetical protein